MPEYGKKTLTIDSIPDNFDRSTVKTITRIEENSRVMGLMFFRNDLVQMSTLPTTLSSTLSTQLPTLTKLFQRAVTEIDVLDDLIAYRIIMNKKEISVVTGNEFAACAVHKLPKLTPAIFKT